MTRRHLGSLALVLCLGCGPTPAALMAQMRSHRALVHAAGLKDKQCRAAVPATATTDPCAALLTCIEGAQAVVDACDDAIHALAAGTASSDDSRVCASGTPPAADGAEVPTAARNLCAKAGVR